MTIEHVAVVIPARNEANLIARCLRSVQHAVNQLQAHSLRTPPAVQIVVVLDSCSDDTGEIVASFPDIDAVVIAAGSVGVARSVGVSSALAKLTVDADRVWIANTDADSVVPPHWLIEQLRLADSGADVVVGTVSPVMDDLPDDLADAWRRVRARRNPAGHVHGANLGLRASNYLLAGGFSCEEVHEDVNLVARVNVVPGAVCNSLDIDVETSGRRSNRVPGGYASYLYDGTLQGVALADDLTN